jgi:hypothetical protein
MDQPVIGQTLLPADDSGKQTGCTQQLPTMHTNRESLHVRVFLLHGRKVEQATFKPQMPPPVLTE